MLYAETEGFKYVGRCTRQGLKVLPCSSLALRGYMHKLEKWGVEICGCTREGLKVTPYPAVA